ncbi:hypothetical protein BK784_08170 [Bacillus thuringiensis serovar medellin]|uniref:Uncharacterized protein n=1 Tax=Bacillus thuringiensis subsp. medellin TaxID=79672 RepID=A0A9X6RHY5_BACTV|nr:hypothetical protein BK784_08170 [Bacillus thuringiensis serovar medellin]
MSWGWKLMIWLALLNLLCFLCLIYKRGLHIDIIELELVRKRILKKNKVIANPIISRYFQEKG